MSVSSGLPESFTMPIMENSTSASYSLSNLSLSAVNSSSYSPPHPSRRSFGGFPESSAISSTHGPRGMKSSSMSIPTPDDEHMVFRAVPRPSDRSMHAVTAPQPAMADPSATRGIGTYRDSFASSASTPFSSAMNAAAGEPSGPVTATTSPTFAPDLSIGGLPSMVPRAVPHTIPGPTFVSPPAMPVPQNSQHWSIPLIMS